MAAESEPIITEEAKIEEIEQLREARQTIERFVEVVEQDGRYPLDAFQFLQAGIQHAIVRTHGRSAVEREELEPDDDHPNHVSGQQLCEALADLALLRYGRLATAVLGGWNIKTTQDWGNMVFLLVDNDLLQKTERDRMSDFDDVLSIKALEAEYEIKTDGEIRAGCAVPSTLLTEDDIPF
jgi:uncharacterized repeat protein (TIGR04138 family)